MTEHQHGASSEDSAESGGLDDELAEAQEDKGYGEDEGERDAALEDDGQ